MSNEAVKAASTVHALAKYYFDKGKYSEAERIFRSMADGERKSATSSQAELAQLLVDQGTALAAMDRPGQRGPGGAAGRAKSARGELLMKRAVAMLEEASGDARDPRLAVPLSNLAECQRRRGQTAQARRGFVRAVAVSKRAALERPRTSGPSACDPQVTLQALSAACRMAGEHRRADEALAGAVAVNLGVPFPARPGRFAPDEVPDDPPLPRCCGPARSFLRMRQHDADLPTPAEARRARERQCKADKRLTSLGAPPARKRGDRARDAQNVILHERWAEECRAARAQKAAERKAAEALARRKAKRRAVKRLVKLMPKLRVRRWKVLTPDEKEPYEEEVAKAQTDADAIEWRTGVRPQGIAQLADPAAPTAPWPTEWELFRDDQLAELREAGEFFAQEGLAGLVWEYRWDPKREAMRKLPKRRKPKHVPASADSSFELEEEGVGEEDGEKAGESEGGEEERGGSLIGATARMQRGEQTVMLQR